MTGQPTAVYRILIDRIYSDALTRGVIYTKLSPVNIPHHLLLDDISWKPSAARDRFELSNAQPRDHSY